MELHRKLVAALLGVAMLVAGCSAESQTDQTEAPPAVVLTTEAAEPSATTTTTGAVTSTTTSTTTTQAPIVMADPLRLSSEALGVADVPVIENGLWADNICPDGSTRGEGDACPGTVYWWHDQNHPRPGETGVVVVGGHLNYEEPMYHLVDDQEHNDDHSVVVGDEIEFELADQQVCTYSVTTPPDTSAYSNFAVELDGQPALYFEKADNTEFLAQTREIFDGRSILVLQTSFGLEEEPILRPGTQHRLYAAVAFAELGGCE